ncbi:hypothetical protein NCC49_004985 [Naganishia albida]|nr:hypothetical protein NCC49_004985 [Naganishia albida]
MPVLKKKGALFPVYHDSPPTTTATSNSKKDVLAARSPTLRHKKQSSIGSKSGLKSDALQQGPRKPLGTVGNAAGRAMRDGAKVGVTTEKENMRSLGMGKPAGKMQVFMDDKVETKPMKTVQTRLGTRRALNDRSQPMHAITALNPHKPASSSTATQDPHFGRGQENIPPPGEYTADRPAPVRRSTRKTTFPSTTLTSVPHPARSTSVRTHDSVLDPDSPYIAKPRLRKVKPPALDVPLAQAAPEPLSQPPVIASSQPPSQPHSQSQPEEPLHSSPLVTRPQTRKQPTNPSATPHLITPLFDPILSDVSEAYGADTSLQPYTSPGLRRSTRLLRAQADERQASGLPSSAYGWIQVSEGRYRAPEPPAARGRKQKKGVWQEE